MAATKSKNGANASQEKKQEEEWKGVLRDLTNETKAYQEARKRKDSGAATQHSERIPRLMLKAAEVHPDPTVKEKFKKDAEEWAKSDSIVKDMLSHPLIQGLGIIVGIPLALAGGAVFAGGALVYGTGKLLVGLGDVLTFGQFRKLTS